MKKQLLCYYKENERGAGMEKVVELAKYKQKRRRGGLTGLEAGVLLGSCVLLFCSYIIFLCQALLVNEKVGFFSPLFTAIIFIFGLYHFLKAGFILKTNVIKDHLAYLVQFPTIFGGVCAMMGVILPWFLLIGLAGKLLIMTCFLSVASVCFYVVCRVHQKKGRKI